MNFGFDRPHSRDDLEKRPTSEIRKAPAKRACASARISAGQGAWGIHHSEGDQQGHLYRDHALRLITFRMAGSPVPASRGNILFMKVRDIIRLLERDGWYLKQTREIIGNTSIRGSRDESRCRASE